MTLCRHQLPYILDHNPHPPSQSPLLPQTKPALTSQPPLGTKTTGDNTNGAYFDLTCCTAYLLRRVAGGWQEGDSNICAVENGRFFSPEISMFLSLSSSKSISVSLDFCPWRIFQIAVVCSLFVCLLLSVSTMKYLLKFYSDSFEILSAYFLWPLIALSGLALGGPSPKWP